MAATMTPELMARAERRAVEDPRFAGVLRLLLDAPTTSAGSFSASAVSAVNNQRRDEARTQFLDNAYSTADVQTLLHLGTTQAVHRLRSRGKLIGRQLGNATWFPKWQFRDGARRSDLDQILTSLTRFSLDAMAADRIMRLQREELGNKSIAEALDQPRRAPIAWTILESLGT